MVGIEIAREVAFEPSLAKRGHLQVGNDNDRAI